MAHKEKSSGYGSNKPAGMRHMSKHKKGGPAVHASQTTQEGTHEKKVNRNTGSASRKA